jgi:magnesium transporter
VTEVLYGLDDAHRDRFAGLRARGRFLWLDVSLSETTLDELREALELSEAAIRALRRSADAHATRTFHADGESVVFVLRCYVESETPADEAAYRLRPLKVYVLVTGEYLVTLHDERVSLPAVLAPDLPEERSKRYAVYSVVDAMLASTFEALEEVELRLDALASTSVDEDGAQVPKTTLRDAGARLAAMRRWVGAEQAVVQRVGVEVGAVLGFDTPGEPYFERVDDQVNRLVASVDAAANGAGMLLDLQLNERAYLISLLATIFAPLTFLTGFFGMNFAWMTDQIDTQMAYWLVGIVVPIALALLCWRLLARRFLMGDDRRPGRR